MDLVRPVSRISQPIDAYSVSNKETEDFKRSLAESVGNPTVASTNHDPTFRLILRLLKESTHPSARDLLNYYYVSSEVSSEAIEYFYNQAKTGDAVARVQLGKLFREGRLTNTSLEIQVIAEAFASQHELAILKIENQTRPTQDQTTNHALTTLTQVPWDSEDQLEDSLMRAKEQGLASESARFTIDENIDSPYRPQHSPMKRIEMDTLDKQVEEIDKKVSKSTTRSTTKSKNKRSKSNGKAKRAKELVNG